MLSVGFFRLEPPPTITGKKPFPTCAAVRAYRAGLGAVAAPAVAARTSMARRAARRRFMAFGLGGAADQGDAVPHREDDGSYPRVVQHVLVEAPDRLGSVVRVGRVDDAAAPERVVGGDQAVRGEPLERGLVVVDVARFVGVDEDEVERPVELLRGVERRPDLDLDLVAVRAAIHEGAGERGALRIELERRDAPVLG